MIIYNPANLKALSTSYNGFYNNGADVTLSGGVLSGFPESDLWTVGVDDHGDYTFSTADGKKLSMGADYTSTPLDEVNTGWKVLPAATEGCYYIQNAARATTWSGTAPRTTGAPYTRVTDEALFAQAFYKVELSSTPSGPGAVADRGPVCTLLRQKTAW